MIYGIVQLQKKIADVEDGSVAEGPHRMSAADIIAALAAAVPGAAYEPLPSADAAVTPTILVPAEHLLATCRAPAEHTRASSSTRSRM